jgi:polar amino acid transport system substrate-binding protein
MLMRKLFALSAGLLWLAATVNAEPLRVGGFIVAPLVTGGGAAPLGGALRAYLEQEVVARAGVPLEWTAPTSLARAMENLKNGRIDILLVSSDRTADLPGAARFDWDYLRTQPHLAVRKDGPLKAVQSLRQLAGLEIGWVGGTRVPEPLGDVALQWQFLSVPDWQAMNLRKLKASRIQAVFFENEYSPRHYAASEHVDIHLIKLPMPERQFCMAYSLKTDPAAIARFNKAAATAFAGEQFKVFLEQFLKR